MDTLWYSPGPDARWLAIARDGRVLVVHGALSQEDVDSMWAGLDEENPVQSTLDRLASGGISSIPPFAMLELAEGSLHGIIRGDVTVVVEGEEPQTVHAAGVSTWAECRIPGVSRAQIGLPGVLPGSDLVLPLRSGVAWVSAVSVGIAPAPADAKPVTVPPVAAPPAEAVEATPGITVLPPPPATEPEGIVELTLVEHTAIPQGPSGSAYAHLFGETVMRSVEEAAVRRADEPAPAAVQAPSRISAPPPAATPDGLHDGQTVVQDEILAIRAARKARGSAASAAPAPALAPAYCLTSRFGTEDLSIPVIIGRAPSVSKVSLHEIPRLITVPGNDQDISRNHVRVAVEGGTVVVTDLDSRNGTQVTMPGRPAQQLRAGVPTPVLPGSIIDLGGGATFTVGLS
jgi:hypothetical protein